MPPIPIRATQWFNPLAVSAATLSGVYTFNTSGFAITSNAVSGPANSAGLLQFDGLGNLTVNLSTATSAATNTPDTLTGSYTVSSNCLGSATLKDSNSNSFVMSFSIYSIAVANTNFYLTLAGASQLVTAGAAHTAYGQPAAGAYSAAGIASENRMKSVPAALFCFLGLLAPSALGANNYRWNLQRFEFERYLRTYFIWTPDSSAGTLKGSTQAVGTATFDGKSSFTLAGTYNTNANLGQRFPTLERIPYPVTVPARD